MSKDIMVSVGMITYNHEEYIAKALDSILMQKVNFKYEIIIGDDASPDNTQSIIKRYADKYPEIIKPILRIKNIGGCDNYIDVKEKCQGKYYITLEGDDYWTDENKLQLQVDFLENHPEYIGVSHWCDVVNRKGEITNEFHNKDKVFNFKKDIYTLNDFKKGQVAGHTTTYLYRNIYRDAKYDYTKIYKNVTLVGDRTEQMILSLMGKIFCMHRIMSHYRYVIEENGTSYSSTVKNRNQCLDWFLFYSKLEQYAKEVMDKKVSFRRMKCYFYSYAVFTMKNNPSDINREIAEKILSSSDEKILLRLYCLVWLPLKQIQQRLRRN